MCYNTGQSCVYYKNFPGEIEGRAQIYVPVCFVCPCLVDCRKWKSGTGKLCLQSVPGYGISGTGVIVLQGGQSPAFLKWHSPLCHSARIPSWEIRKEGGGGYEYI